MGNMKVDIKILHERASASGSRAVAGVSGGGRQGLAEGMMEGGFSPKEQKAIDLKALKLRLKNAKAEEGMLTKMLRGIGGGGGGIGKVAGGAMAGLGGAAAATGVGAVVAIAALILKKMIENSEAVKAIRTAIDMMLGSILDTLFGSLFVLNNLFISGGELTKQVIAIPDKIGDWFKWALDGFMKGLSDTIGLFKSIYWDEPIKQWNEGIDRLRGGVDFLIEKGKVWGGYIDRFGTWLTALPGNMWDSITKAIDTGLKWLTGLGDTVTAWIGRGIGTAIDTVLSGPDGLGDKFGAVITGMGTGFTTLISNLTNPFTNLQNTISGLDFSPFSTFLKLDFSKITDFFKLDFDKPKQFIQSLTGSLSLPGSSGGGSGNPFADAWDAIT